LSPTGLAILVSNKRAGAKPEELAFSSNRGTPLDRHNLLNRQLKPAGEKLKIPKVTWHWLRHANATLLDSVGAPLGTVQSLLGHATSEITREVYIHAVPADARGAVQKVDDLIGPKWTQIPKKPEFELPACG
jgi:integrase